MTTPSISAGPSVPFDPIRFCVYTTVALLAWFIGPPLMVMVMSGLGLWGYSRAVRYGLTRTKCVLKNPKLVLAYLGTVFAAGAVGFGFEIVRFVHRLS